MGKWMDLAAQLEREATEGRLGNRDNSDISSPIVPIVTIVHSSRCLPVNMAVGLDKLRTMRPPRITNAAVWPQIVADAVSLADGGWARQAIDLSWDPLHLFGWEPSTDPEIWNYSLAVATNGWPVVDVSTDCITLRKGNVSRPFKKRPRPALTRYLWEL